MKSLAELGEIAKYANEEDYLWDEHHKATGKSLNVGNPKTRKWARKKYGDYQEHNARVRSTPRPITVRGMPAMSIEGGRFSRPEK